MHKHVLLINLLAMQ